MSLGSLATAPVRASTGALFGGLSALRGRRIFHPDGLVFRGALRGTPQAPEGAPALRRTEPTQALLRFSRGAGLPQPLPDILGLAVRLVDLHGPGRHQDLLLNTSADLPLAHHLLLPAGGFFGRVFSSALVYRVGGELLLFGARAISLPAAGPRHDLDVLRATAARGGLRFELLVAPVEGRFRPVGTLEAGDRVLGEEAELLRFNPWHTGGGIVPWGPLNGLRRTAYRASQRGWGAPPDPLPVLEP